MRALISLAFLAALTACKGGEDPRVTEILDLTGDATAGATVYASACADCHGAEGEGDIGPALTEHMGHHPDAEIVEIVLDGRSGMTAFETLLTPQEIADLLAFLRESWGEYEG
jgi:cytochrome c oxidase subunit 2